MKLCRERRSGHQSAASGIPTMLASFVLSKTCRFGWPKDLPRLAASVVAGWTTIQGNGYGHKSRSPSVRPQSVSSCCPSPLSTQKSALTVSQRLGTSIPGVDSRNGQLCMIIRKQARIALHSINALGEIRRQRRSRRRCRSKPRALDIVSYKTKSTE